MEVILRGLVAVAANYVVHYGAARIYDTFCVPHNLSEVVRTLFTTSSPICVVSLGTMQMTQNNYGTLLTTTLASPLVQVLKIYIRGNPTRLAPIPKPAPVRADAPTLGA